MGRGVSSGGGLSSLGYMFGKDEPPTKAAGPPPAAVAATPESQQKPAGNKNQRSGAASSTEATQSQTAQDKAPKDLPAAGKTDSGTSLDMGQTRLGRNSNNYHRSDGQNTGNFITDRPTTKVHAAPGGSSSLSYLFGGPEQQ